MPYLQCNNTKCTSESLEISFDQYLLQNGLTQDDATEEEIQDAINYAVQECESSIEEFVCIPIVNEIDTSKISRIDDGNWQYDGTPIEGCVPPPNITAPFTCVYEVKPLRPSATYWSDVNRGQCLVNKAPIDGCGNCSRTWENPRKDPIYMVGSGQDGCPATFCNKCEQGLESICGCCGVNKINSFEENPQLISQSGMNGCDSCTSRDVFGKSTCCPDCCSLCNDNGEDLCNEVVERPNWQSDCNTDSCGWCYWDFIDCGLLNRPYVKELKGNICDVPNPCDPDSSIPLNCSYSCIDESCNESDDYSEYNDGFGDDNGGFGKDGSFDPGGGLGN